MVSIGTSYGGMVAMAHAARHPDAVSHLILIVTAAHGGFIPRAQEILRNAAPRNSSALRNLWAGEIRTSDALRHYFEVMGPLYARRNDPVAAKAGLARAIHTPEPLNRAFGPGGFLRDFDLRPELSRITAPTLILAGRHDWICPVEFSEELHQLIPGSELIVFAESSHSVRVDAPEAMVGAIREFVGKPVAP